MADRQKLEAVRELLFLELKEDLIQRGTPAAQRERFEECLKENTAGGKLSRGLAVVNTGFSFLKRRLTEVEHEDLSILGWLNELFQAAYLILDDIMDNSEYPERQAMQLGDTTIGRNSTAGAMTEEHYTFIVTNKTAFYNFYLPVALGLHYVRGASEKKLERARNILLQIGEYFQIQDDYLDVNRQDWH
ncbi:hypothetical protein CNMCM8980_000432 [Aspergillus fumigatiaffinis]|uniref:Uncharacterized protein n=1 Tax=Aspergillus fumigatiaffinis TaxID=340414 RepID=A0A8H4HF44_9EURO|nr:hypothetical protein CNMCM6457_003037 [Aspergillus fumigatiaffinis]KAF4220849.1 hypothetical protein CNMCM5878_000505 [Aspergillus fumigatiaffinis]KAF4242104.1 hypothetical protein CNMCM6805_003219 [Aspergillus fumigatiaffinis]KAF4250602.1 hypothetical protein CNMCM8980_000432 [Aspergillus fumigatiaffinis]